MTTPAAAPPGKPQRVVNRPAPGQGRRTGELAADNRQPHRQLNNVLANQALAALWLPPGNAEEVRWLLPEFQAPAGALAARKAQLGLEVDQAATLPAWPKDPVEQSQALRAALSRTVPLLPKDLAKQWRGARPAKLSPILNVLAGLGQARMDAGRYHL